MPRPGNPAPAAGGPGAGSPEARPAAGRPRLPAGHRVVPLAEVLEGGEATPAAGAEAGVKWVAFTLGEDSVGLNCDLHIPLTGDLLARLADEVAAGPAGAGAGLALVLNDGQQRELVSLDVAVVEKPVGAREAADLDGSSPLARRGEAGRGLFAVFHPWGAYARTLRMLPGDRLHLLFRHQEVRPAKEAAVRGDAGPTVHLWMTLRRVYAVLPPLQAWDHNVQAEAATSLLGFTYIRSSVPTAKFLTSMGVAKWKDASAKLKVKRRLRVCPSGPCGWGVWAQEDIPRGQHLFNYAGEVISTHEARAREKVYKADGDGEVHYLYDIVIRNKSGKQGRQVTATIDSTMFGNIARFVNHRCHDPSMHVVVDTGTLYPTSLALPLIKFYSKRDIRAGEELTVDYSPGADTDTLAKQVVCKCMSLHCRGWLF